MVLILGLLVIAILAIFNVVPLTFFTMLFLGNLGIHLGFWDLLPGAIAIHIVKNNIITYNKGK